MDTLKVLVTLQSLSLVANVSQWPLMELQWKKKSPAAKKKFLLYIQNNKRNIQVSQSSNKLILFFVMAYNIKLLAWTLHVATVG